jgi:phosphate/sulfate permease
MYDFLLFVHVLFAFMLVGTVVIYGAVALGAPVSTRTTWIGDRLCDVGGLGTLVFGVWLAINLDAYKVWDGWVIAAIVLWMIATGLGDKVRRDGGSGLHWLRTLVVLLILVDMIWKPGA